MRNSGIKLKVKGIYFAGLFLTSTLLLNSLSAETPPLDIQGLAKLPQINIVIETIGPMAKELGLTVSDIKSQVVVALRNKVPKLRISESASDSFYVDVQVSAGKTVSGQKTDYYGMVQLKVFRLGTIVATNMTRRVIVWDTRGILTGPLSDARIGVNEALDIVITSFAADWLRANP
jgi:hypothetical protein